MSEMVMRVAVAVRRRKFERTGRLAVFDETNITAEELDDAKAAIEAMREPTEAMEDAADALDDWGVPSDPGSGNASAVAHWHAMIEEALK